MNITKEQIMTSLSALPLQKGDTLLVHSSLKSAGIIENGAETVISALLDTLGAEGTLVMPTLSQKDFQNAYRDWHMDRPSDVGYITEVFRTRTDAVRSDQATHSVAAVGPLARYYTENHGEGPREGTFGATPFAHCSPWQKLYDNNAAVLLWGVDLSKNTLKHLWEYMIAEKALERAEERGTYQETMGLLRTFERRTDQSGKYIFTGLAPETMKQVGEEQGCFSYAVLGNALFTFFRAKDFGDVVLKDVAANPRRWYPEQTLDWLCTAFGDCQFDSYF